MKKSALFLLTGIAVGFVAGMLLSPDQGLKTRKKWRKMGKKYKKAFEEKVAEYREKGASFAVGSDSRLPLRTRRTLVPL